MRRQASSHPEKQRKFHVECSLLMTAFWGGGFWVRVLVFSPMILAGKAVGSKGKQQQQQQQQHPIGGESSWGLRGSNHEYKQFSEALHAIVWGLGGESCFLHCLGAERNSHLAHTLLSALTLQGSSNMVQWQVIHTGGVWEALAQLAQTILFLSAKQHKGISFGGLQHVSVLGGFQNLFLFEGQSSLGGEPSPNPIVRQGCTMQGQTSAAT